jgi:predicted aldo/keto reductase-like oxidoreductase
MKRRDFVKAAAICVAVSSSLPTALAQEKSQEHGLTEDGSIQLIRSAINRGITFMDNCWDYNEGQSEMRMGKALKDGYREQVFLMTKIDGRTKEVARRQIETSLERLQTDHIDLVQHHEILRFDDPDRIFAEGGAMEALIEARQAGKIRYIGFTGHKDPHIHLHMLKIASDHGFHFDTTPTSAVSRKWFCPNWSNKTSASWA